MALGLALPLAACTASSNSSDERVGRFLVSPGKYVIYNCAQIAQATAGVLSRQKDLDALKAKAGQGAAGRMVSAFAYEPEYLQMRGEIYELRKAAAEKNCKFVPGEERPGAR